MPHMLWLLPLALQATDTLRITPAGPAVNFDGGASAAEYGDPTLTFDTRQGTVGIWIRRDSGAVIFAAAIPDSTRYWGDDLVISLDTGGDRAGSPQHDDCQWYFRRVLDSSVVLKGEAGHWRLPRDDPDWRLGPEREGGGWTVRAAETGAGWSLELRLDPAYFTQAGSRTPGIAFRVFDNDPQGWFPYPSPPGIRQPTDVERRPALWLPVTSGS